MTRSDPVTLYYSPQTRATGARVLLEELGAPYDLHVEVGQEIMLADVSGSKLSNSVWRGEEQPEGL